MVSISGDGLLVAAGVVPNSDTLNLEAAGVETNERGFIKVDDHLRTTAPNVWALGDIVGNYLFRHSVNLEGEYLFRTTIENPVDEAVELTQQFLSDIYDTVEREVARGGTLKECFDKANDVMRPKYGDWPIFEHCQPFNISRAYDEARGIDTPRVWTDKRDVEMWEALQD